MESFQQVFLKYIFNNSLVIMRLHIFLKILNAPIMMLVMEYPRFPKHMKILSWKNIVIRSTRNILGSFLCGSTRSCKSTGSVQQAYPVIYF